MKAVGPVTVSTGLRMAPHRHEEPVPAKLEGRALVPAARPTPRAARSGRQRPDAAFLAHLIATREQVPQTRARRRHEPEHAAGAYAMAMAAAGVSAGAIMSRKM